MSDHHHLTGDHHPSPASAATTALGPLLLLPSELLHDILIRLALPELLRVRSVARPLSHVISSPDFRRLYHLSSAASGPGPAAAWLLVFKKLRPRDAALRGFHGPSGRWFRIPVSAILAPAVPPGEDLYFLAASGSSFLFAANGRRELVVVDLSAHAARRLPPSPLGPRGTSSWRRFGLKLVADPPGSSQFRFLFAELVNNTPLLFEYQSETDTWQSSEAVQAEGASTAAGTEGTFLCAAHAGPDCVMVYSGPGVERPVFFRPRFPHNPNGGGDRLHVYGDGSAAVVRSTVIDEPGRPRVKVVAGVDLYGFGSVVGGDWQLASTVPGELVEGFRKPYAVMTGLLSEREGVVRLVLISNCRGAWDIVWLSYDRARGEWWWVPVPDWGTKGLNVAGIAVSSTFSRLWPPAAASSCTTTTSQ
ncbi:uncharacterized protein [Oryza sativa Japonica Group]|jgi:hypothetical protein|uniref:Os01g0647000 protein n=5 Tax=Oryza TaxID=4527 RepID=A0A0P0V5V0_ORYSJ|nr:uncharacterized protein LOC4325927 [Oryza sativa Japonica Group]EAY75168.1 hypothetical protein OsI_03060 [Oryza sativa Indica Group]KAB8082677.1 hypothetical protein EE612_004650 [Oryza sativa]EAZ12892.1 hypothetical protein OsJ_02813 [Oryza sativa Japonica Group]KAF2951413.1 hypothetical protein DAI22_01g260000 [Oryza sativa Japonica Group]USI00506.1 F-box domain-containing protein [Oryza sativa Japonica Group]|eukprot:NP_001043709.1 Os01g0647000 [Oryza sativa Japonica Group]